MITSGKGQQETQLHARLLLVRRTSEAVISPHYAIQEEDRDDRKTQSAKRVRQSSSAITTGGREKPNNS